MTNIRPYQRHKAGACRCRSWFAWSEGHATLAIVVISLIAGGSYYMGQRDKEVETLRQQINQTEMKVTKADEKATYVLQNLDSRTGHATNSNTNTQTKSGGH